MNWSETTLGPVAQWPQSLRTTVSICLASDLPICVIWGPGLVQLYNDAYRVICGDKHPRSMGQKFSTCWQDAWPVIGHAHDSALAGDTAFLESQHIYLQRHGYVEECFFTFSFSPIRDEAGQVGGLFHPVIEVTAKMLAERRTRALRDLTLLTSQAKSVAQALALAAQSLASYNLDLPFTLLYALSADGQQAQLAGSSGLKEDAIASLHSVAMAQDPSEILPLADVQRSHSAVQLNGLKLPLGAALSGPYPEPADSALLLPIIRPGTDHLVAILVAGISARLPMNEAYRSFYDLLASGISTAIANAAAFEDERRHVLALAELDRAKTAFFSNVSHEFRTPLTLMLGPVEDVLAASDEDLPPVQRERLELVYRNGLRLQRLVNNLLEFSRIEAGRVHAAFEPTDIADFTADLASNFRSACERAGLELRVDCPRLTEPVFVDRPMWEKIVLNLLSNAFKFTFHGEIVVSMRQTDAAAELCVKDTGTGIPAEQLLRLFERFHRVENARGRTHEGSGIGLALVQELVKLHGGSISATSEVGHGTTFMVRIPLGSQHLPHDQVGSGRTDALPTAQASPFALEALGWLPDTSQSLATGSELLQLADEAAAPASSLDSSIQQADVNRPLVLVADDNADMRQYIVRLLGPRYRTEAVPDGQAALAAALARMPALVLTDVMMPRLDGFGLLKALRADPRTSGVPIIMLSARAGEESRIEGLQQGADDYMVKPFSGRELLARVTAHLQMARIRQEASAAIQAGEEQFRALVSASSDVVYRMNADWTEMRHHQGREFIADTNEPNHSWLEKYIHPGDQQHVLQTIRQAVQTKGIFELEHRVLRVDGTLGWTFSRAIPLLDHDGKVVEWLGMASDVTARKQVQAALTHSEQKFRALFESMDEGYCVIEMIFDADGQPADYRFLEVNPAFEKHTGLRDAQGKRMREIAPHHEAHWFETYGRVAMTGEAIRFENKAKALNGRWFDVYAFRLGDNGSHKIAVLFTDITDRKANEDALIASETRSRDILESITDGFFSLDCNWCITYINAAGERFLDRTPGDLIGKSLWEEFPGTVGSEFERVYRRVAASRLGESFTAYYTNFDRWYELTANPAPKGLTVYFRDVTDRRKVEEERKQFAALVDASSDFIAVAGLDQRGTYLNRAGEEMIGLAPGQVGSISIVDCFPESERGRVIGLINDSQGDDHVIVDTWFQHLQTGELIPVSWAFLKLRDANRNISGYATVTRNLTQTHEAEKQLQISEKQRDMALGAAELGMWHVDPATRTTKTDARFRNIFGTAEEWTDYLQAVAVVHPDDQQAVLDAVAAATRLDNPAPYVIEYRIIHPGGSVRWILANGRASFEGIGAAKRVTSFDGTVADITNRKRGEQERERLVDQLKEQDQRKDEFLATLAHELRNPLAPIRNGLQILRQTNGDLEATEKIRLMMERQVNQMVHLIDDLLDLSRISRGKIELRRERIDLAGAIEQAIEATRPTIEKAGHELLIDMPGEPIYVDADLTRLTQIFSNLLNNAAKFTEQGGRVKLTVEQKGADVFVTVTDNGIGIAADMITRVFEMFTQVDGNLGRAHSGLGIGLCIVQRLVTMHGGSVLVRSGGIGRGSEFVVRLPLAMALVASEPAMKTSTVSTTTRLRILVADDNVDAADSLSLLLTLEGYDTQTAHDGQEALDTAAAFRPDVVLLDIGMPKLNGYDVCRRLRQQPWGKKIIVMALTGWGQEADRQQSQDAGVDFHLVKPVDYDAVKNLLAQVAARV